MSDLEMSMDLDLTTQAANYGEMAPKVVVSGLKVNLDKKKSHIDIKGGVVEWMMQFVERMFNKYIFNYMIKEFEKEMTTTFQTEINNLAKEHL